MEKVFKIRIVETWEETIDVKANSLSEAEKKVTEDYEKGNFDFSENANVKCEIRNIGK